MPRLLLGIVFTIISIAYPVLIYTGLKYQVLNYLIVFIAFVFFIRFICTRKVNGIMATAGRYSLACACLLCVFSLVFKKLELMLFYPVIVNAILFIVFTASILGKRPIITVLAMLKEKELSPFAISYTRILTIFWAVFFVINGLIALYTAIINDLKVWTLYNGFISYILIGIIFTAEFILRVFLKKKYDNK